MLSSGGCQSGCKDHVVKWWMSAWVWMLLSCCEVVDVTVGVDVMGGGGGGRKSFSDFHC